MNAMQIFGLASPVVLLIVLGFGGLWLTRL